MFVSYPRSPGSAGREQAQGSAPPQRDTRGKRGYDGEGKRGYDAEHSTQAPFVSYPAHTGALAESRRKASRLPQRDTRGERGYDGESECGYDEGGRAGMTDLGREDGGVFA